MPQDPSAIMDWTITGVTVVLVMLALPVEIVSFGFLKPIKMVIDFILIRKDSVIIIDTSIQGLQDKIGRVNI